MFVFKGGALTKLYDEAVKVDYDAASHTVRSFVWRKRSYPISSVVSTWKIRHTLWDESKEIDRIYFRVQTVSGGSYDLYWDRRKRTWRLERVWD